MFKFLKRLRAKKEEADTPELATAETAEKAQTKASAAKQAIDKPESSAAPAAAEAVSPREADEHKNPPASENAAQPDIESLPQEEAPDFTQDEIPTRDEQVIEVELPKRSLGDGIRSLFTSSLDIEDLEDILLALPVDVRILGVEYADKDFTGKRECLKKGIKIVHNSRDHSFSSTQLRTRVLERERDRIKNLKEM